MAIMERNNAPRATGSPFSGTGEMAAMMRTLAWSDTPLGPAERWPTSLRTMIAVVLESRFPMLLWWGPELLHLYNDAYRPILGDKHPRALAAPGHEVWREIWHIIGPQAEGVLAGAPATWNEHLLLPMNRKGFIEETYFTFSYSPVPDDSGARAGVLVTVQETTAQVQDERQLTTLRELAARATEANTAREACETAARILAGNDADAPFALLYLADPDGRLELVSAAGFDGDASARPECAPQRWPLAEADRAGPPVIVDDLVRRVGELPGGRWGCPPDAAICAPLARHGQRPYGFLVCGVSPRRLLDERYRGFFVLAADQVATAIANARAHQEARERAEALAALDRAKTAFFSNISHEFRTPLTLLLAPLDDLLRAPELAPAARERVALAHRNALRLLRLVGSMLDFSRIEAGRMQATYEPTDLAEATADLASAFRSACERAGLRLVVDCPPLGEPVHVDRDMWEKIVLNLLSNALKFTTRGEIAVRVRRVGARVELAVQDTGVGIPAAELPRVFERFYRVESARGRTHEGSGIGLALVLELVKLHGGDIDVTSEVGRGTTFTVSLPLGAAHLPAEHVRPPRESGAPIHVAAFLEEAQRWLPANDAEPPPVDASAPRPRIVLADDNADMRDYLCRLLGERWDVEAVRTGREALAATQRQRPDLVLTDVMMPELDGVGLLAALRADPATRDLPVLVVSARAGEEARVEGLRSGADDYLVKPFSARELVARVDALLLRDRLRSLESAQARRLARIFAQAPVAIALLRGPQLVYESTNPAYDELVLGRPVAGRPIRDALPELAGQGVFEILERAYATGEPFVGRAFKAALRRRPDEPAQDRYYDFVYQPLLDDAGAVEGIAVVAFEISALVKAREEADAANRAKDEFLAMLGHELRNPLSPIVTALQLMNLRGETGSPRERAIIERQVRHLTGLVDDLLDISRITRGKVELRRRRVELADVVAQAIETASPMLEQHRHELRVDVARAGLVVDADADRLAQVLANLLTNAAKYTRPGGRIAVTAAREGDEVALRVRDSGIGIDPDFMPHIFEPFSQARQAIDRSSGGLGLGLAIVRSLVGLHGGAVSAASEGRGRGAEFTVRLPAPGPEAPEDAAAPAHASPADGDDEARRVLVVDDNEDAAHALAAGLGLLGYRVRIAHDGPSALRLAETFEPDIALLDIGLPVMDGYELARRFTEHPRLARALRIAITGYGQDRDRRRSAAAGFSAHIVKPIELDRLHAILARLDPPAA
jgi:signal transduction histidine kinase